MSKLLLYCTKAKPYLRSHSEYEYNEKGAIPETRKRIFTLSRDKCDYYNGKIVAECDFEIEEIFGISKGTNQPDKYDFKWEDSILNGACLTNDQMNDYIPNYAIHIKNLHIFDKPRELSEYHNNNSSPIEKAPQNMMRVWLFENGEWVMYILISIQPQWLCLILNHIKDVEVRKKVLKEMLKNE